MKTIVLLSLFLTGPMAFSSTDLDAAYQREYLYLTSQRQAQKRQYEKMVADYSARTSRLRAEVANLQRKLTTMAAAHDELHENLMTLEKKKKELARRGLSIESTVKRAMVSTEELQKALRFEPNKEKQQPTLSKEVTVADLNPLIDRTLDLLKSSSDRSSYEGTFLSSDDQLKAGKIQRVGRVAAFIQDQDRKVLLGPNGQGQLKELETETGRGQYFFDNMMEAAHVERAATFLERLADLGPLFFLALMLLLVAGLFMALLRA
ncbi:MAG: hypothetical protein AB7F86_05865 [Bdellovibrionales bacterium]